MRSFIAQGSSLQNCAGTLNICGQWAEGLGLARQVGSASIKQASVDLQRPHAPSDRLQGCAMSASPQKLEGWEQINGAELYKVGLHAELAACFGTRVRGKNSHRRDHFAGSAAISPSKQMLRARRIPWRLQIGRLCRCEPGIRASCRDIAACQPAKPLQCQPACCRHQRASGLGEH